MLFVFAEQSDGHQMVFAFAEEKQLMDTRCCLLLQNKVMDTRWCLFLRNELMDIRWCLLLQNELLGTSDSSEDELLEAGDFYKMVFVVNAELGMGVGKVAAQVAHAALNLYRLVVENAATYNEMLLCWEQFG